MMMTRADCGELLAMARRHARGRVEAEDLMQQALLAALMAGRRGGAADRPWLAGVMRNLARMSARSDMRRRRRETAMVALAPDGAQAASSDETLDLEGMPAGLRIVAALALAGQTRGEIRYLLGISDEALRQRITGIRRHLGAAGARLPEGLPGLRGGLAFGAVRHGLMPITRQLESGFATHDPDGHGIVFGKMRMRPHEMATGGNSQA